MLPDNGRAIHESLMPASCGSSWKLHLPDKSRQPSRSAAGVKPPSTSIDNRKTQKRGSIMGIPFLVQ
jgi:hypothetical protein